MKRFFVIFFAIITLLCFVSCEDKPQHTDAPLETACWKDNSIHTIWGISLSLFYTDDTLYSYSGADFLSIDGEFERAENGMYRLAGDVAKVGVGFGTVYLLKTDGRLYTCRSPVTPASEQVNLPSGNDNLTLTFENVADAIEDDRGVLVLTRDGRLINTYDKYKSDDRKYEEALDGTRYFVAATNVKRVIQAGFIIKNDDSLWGCGVNNGRLGTGVYEELGTVSPYKTKYKDYVHITDNVKDVVFTSHDLVATVYALKNDGSVWAWGGNEFGYIGNGTHGDGMLDTLDIVSEPVKILDGISEIVAGASLCSCYALSQTGTLYAWGDNNTGTLGLPDSYTGAYQLLTGVVPTPTPVLENCIFVSPENSCHSLAITADGSLYMWGLDVASVDENAMRAYETVAAPKKIADNAVYAVESSRSTYYIDSEGGLWGWGFNMKMETILLGKDAEFFTASPILLDSDLFAVGSGKEE